MVTVRLSTQALGALEACLRAGAARGLPFEHALLDAVCRSAVTPESRRRARRALSPRTLRKVREYVEGHLADDIGVADIAEAACVSPHHLGRGFRAATGQSLWQYVLTRRAIRARTLIDTRPLTTLSEIASLCGFESYGQFIAAFRKVHGLAPSGYRRDADGQ